MPLQTKLDSSAKAHIVIIGHTGWVPPRGELNMHLTLDTNTRELVVQPILTGTPEEQDAQLVWFHLMYADRGLLQSVINFQLRGVIGALEGMASKASDLGRYGG